MMNEVWKILGICIIGSAISIILKPKSGEYSFLIALATGIIALTFVINAVSKPINEINGRLLVSGVETEYSLLYGRKTTQRTVLTIQIMIILKISIFKAQINPLRL